MTNAEKYKEVFGFEPERKLDCICSDCTKCPIDANYCDKYLVLNGGTANIRRTYERL